MLLVEQKKPQVIGENEFDISDIEDLEVLDDIEPYDNSRETYDYNYTREDEDRTIPELKLNSVQQQSDIIGYDSIKLKFPLIYAEEVAFTVTRTDFFRNKTPNIPANKDETKLSLLFSENSHCRQMSLTEKEQEILDLNTYDTQPFRKAKLEFPNAKPFFDIDNLRLGLGHMYFYNGEFIMSITGKIVSGEGNLGLITRNNIDEALNEIKSTGLVNFNNEAFRERAEVLSTHVTNDLLTDDVSDLKSFSSFLPMRTDRYCVLNYGNSGYEILARGKQSKQTPNYQFCIYNKGAEIREHKQRSYIKRIGGSGMAIANNTIRMELRLRNFSAIRKFLAPERKKGTLTLNELLACEQRPVIQMLSLLNITTESLKEARGKYITMVEEDTYPTQAEFERMHGLIRLLELHEYDLSKVRSYIEVETKHKTHTTYFKEKRDILQRYITCYMPQTVANLSKILEVLSY